MEFETLPLWIAKTHSGGRHIQYSAKRLALHLTELFPVDIWTGVGVYGGEKNLEKNLEMNTTAINGPRGRGELMLGTLSNRRRQAEDGTRKLDISFETSLRMYNTL